MTKNLCVKCDKAKAVLKCGGCLQRLCSQDFDCHRQDLNEQLNEIQHNHEQFRQLINEETDPLIEQINQWESESIEKIKQKADEARQLVSNHLKKCRYHIEEKLNVFSDELKQRREENDFIESELNEWKDKLVKLKEEFNRPKHVKIEENSSTLIKNLSVIISSRSSSILNIQIEPKWKRNGVTVAGSKSYGTSLSQLYYPWDVFVDCDQTILVADQSNNRIMQWNKGVHVGQLIAGNKSRGNENDQLYYPSNVIVDCQNEYLIISDRRNQRIVRWTRCSNNRTGEIILSNINSSGLAMDSDGYLYVADLDTNEVRQYRIGDQNGRLVAGGNGAGSRLDQFNGPYFIFVDEYKSVYVSDYYNNRVMKWSVGAKEGVIVAGGNGQGSDFDQLSGPRGLAVDVMGNVFVVDQGNNRVMYWLNGNKRGSVVAGGNGRGGQMNQFNDPIGLSFDQENNIYVVDSGNHRVQKFCIDSNSILESKTPKGQL